MQGKILWVEWICKGQFRYEYSITVRRLGRRRIILEAHSENRYITFITGYRFVRSVAEAEEAIAKAHLGAYVRIHNES